MLTSEHRKKYIEIIRQLPVELDSLIQGLTNAQLSTVYVAGEWTIAQIVHHLVDMHMNSYLRLKLILSAERPDMQILDQDILARMPDAIESDIQSSLMILRGLHDRWVVAWENLTDEQWRRIGLIRGVKEITPDYLVEGYARHCENHLNQIRSLLASQQ